MYGNYVNTIHMKQKHFCITYSNNKPSKKSKLDTLRNVIRIF